MFDQSNVYSKLQLWMVFRLALLWAKISENIKCPEQLSIRQKQSMEDLCATQGRRVC